MVRSTIIIGGDSLIGRGLAVQLRRAGSIVHETTRRPRSPGDKRIFLDLLTPTDSWPDLPAAADAVMCAAITRIADCEVDPIKSNIVNMESTLALIRRLTARGTFVLFLSSVAVFDGRVARRPADAPICPINIYGYQKAVVERAVLDVGPGAAVLRLAKVIDPEMPLLRLWRSNLNRREPIAAFADMTMAPISLDMTTELIVRILRERLPGLFQASGDTDLPFTYFGERFTQALGLPSHFVHATTAKALGMNVNAIPKYTSLDMEREARVLGIGCPSSIQMIDDVMHKVAALDLTTRASAR